MIVLAIWLPYSIAFGQADHDGGGSRRRENRLRPSSGRDVARGDHRHVDPLDQLGGERMVGLAGVHLLRRARVERERSRTRGDEPGPDVEARSFGASCSRKCMDGRSRSRTIPLSQMYRYEM